MNIDGTTEVTIHHVIKKNKGFEVTLFDFSSAMSGAIIQYKDLLYYAVDTTEEYKKIEKKLEIAMEALKYYGHLGNWNGGQPANRCHPLDMEDIKDSCCKIHMGKFGGKKAREALAKIELLNQPAKEQEEK